MFNNLFLKIEIKQRYAFAFSHHRSMKADEIAEIFAEIYGEQSYSIDSIRYWLRQIKVGRTNLYEQPIREKHKDNAITFSVKTIVDNNPLFSARQIAKLLCIFPCTVINRLTNYLCYHCYQSKWVIIAKTML